MLPGLLYLTLAMGPSVAVEVAPRDEQGEGTREESMESLRSWLVQRLIEEGVTIAPSPERADRVVRLHDTEDAVIVEMDEEEHRVEHGPRAVMRLEVLHRARLAIEGPDDEAPVTSPPRSDAVIGMRSIGEAPPGFEGALESQLLSAGYVLTPEPRAGDPVLCVNHDKVAVSVSLTKVGAACGDPTIRLTYTQIQSPGGVDPIVEAVRGKKVDVEPVPQERPTAHDLPGKPPPAPAPRVATKSRRREPWSQENAEVRIGAEGGLAARGGIDGSVRAFLRMGITPGPGAMLHVAVVPSGAGRSIRVVDTTLAAGPDVHLRRKRFGFDAGLVAGANIHAYQVDRDRGGRVSWYLGVPLSISLGRQFGPRVHLFTEAAMAGIRPVEHVSNSGVRWNRAAWLVRAGLGVSFGWRIL